MTKALRLSDIKRFTAEIFDSDEEARKGASILKAILDARSLRLSDLSQAMRGIPQANYKAIHRFLKASSPPRAHLRLYQEDAPFILVDPTEIARPQARRTEYVGILKDGKTPGFGLLLLATPYRGRAIPFHFITYSSRNLEYWRAPGEVRELIGDKPLVNGSGVQLPGALGGSG